MLKDEIPEAETLLAECSHAGRDHVAFLGKHFHCHDLFMMMMIYDDDDDDGDDDDHVAIVTMMV